MTDEQMKLTVLQRLRLAQLVLENSDRLPGFEGYQFSEDLLSYHDRHAFEALCLYLLLTCFDFIGQRDDYRPFADWLKSNKSSCVQERAKIVDAMPNGLEPAQAAASIFDGYNSLYGVRNAFIAGIRGLPIHLRSEVLGAVRISVTPFYGGEPNVSYPNHDWEGTDAQRENRIIKYLFSFRNKFTYELRGQFSASLPALGVTDGLSITNSFIALIRDGSLVYGAPNQDREYFNKGKSSYTYTTQGIIFTLFKVLHEYIGTQFNVTQIAINFTVLLFDHQSNPSRMKVLNGVPHDQLRNPKALFLSHFPMLGGEKG